MLVHECVCLPNTLLSLPPPPSSSIVAHCRPSPTIQIPKWLKPPAQAPPPLEMPPKRIPCPRKLANGQYWVLVPHLNARKPSWTLWLSKSQEAARGREEKEGGRRKGRRAPQLGASTVSYVHRPSATNINLLTSPLSSMGKPQPPRQLRLPVQTLVVPLTTSLHKHTHPLLSFLLTFHFSFFSFILVLLMLVYLGRNRYWKPLG